MHEDAPQLAGGGTASARTQLLLREMWSRPEDFAALLSLRDHLLEEGRVSSLLRAVEWWAQRAPDERSAARGMFAVAEALRVRRLDPEAAMGLYEEVLRREPLHAPTLQRLRRMATAHRAPERLVAPLQRRAEALAVRHTAADACAAAWKELAELRAVDLGDEDGAIDALHRAVQVAPGDAGTLLRLAGLYEARARRGDGSNAQADRVAAAELLCALARVDEDEAGAHLGRALDAWPGHAKAMALLEEATPSAHRAARLMGRWVAFLEANPSSDESAPRRLSLARALEAGGRFAEALEVLEPLRATGGPAVQAVRERLAKQLWATEQPTRVGPQPKRGTDASIVALLDELEAEAEGPTEVSAMSADVRARLRGPAPAATRDVVVGRPVPSVTPLPTVVPARSEPVDEALEKTLPSKPPHFGQDPFADEEAPTAHRALEGSPRPAQGDDEVDENASTIVRDRPPELEALARRRRRDATAAQRPSKKPAARKEPTPPSTPPALPEARGGVAAVPSTSEPTEPLPRLRAPKEGVEPRLWDDAEEDEDVVLAPDGPPVAKALRATTLDSGAQAPLAADLVRLRDGRTVGTTALPLRPWGRAVAGTPFVVARRGEAVHLQLRFPVEQGDLRRGGVPEALPPMGRWVELRAGDVAELELEGTTYHLRVHRRHAVPAAGREELPTRRFLGAAGASFGAHLLAMLAFVALGVWGGVSLEVEERSREEIFAEARLAPEPPPEPERPEPRPQPRRARPEPPSETRTPVPRAVRRHLRRARRSGSASSRLASALSEGAASQGTTDLAEVVSNIDAVRGDARSAALSVHGALADLGDHGVNLASRAARDIETVGSETATRNLEGVRASGSGRTRGRVRGVRALARVQGSLSRGEVVSVINRHIARVQRCYERALASQPDLSGRVRFAWTIRPNGRVSGVRQAGGSLGSGRVSNCIGGVIRRMRFPRPRGGPVAVTFPFVFQRAP
ncbi:MAG: hypothetical protein CMN29_13325 [Sandaracinus sp.]|nr:hypothetical protein [Myxococcales bacterium]MAT25922.1 hypothetical protein [Sandaracinus sp.]